MKKFLAIVLSIMMVLGVCSVGVFAFDEANLPALPQQTENYIYFSAGHVRATANETYDIPIYMISNYNTSIQDGFCELGFSFYLSDSSYATVNSVTFDNEIKAIADFTPLECYFGYTSAQMEGNPTWHTEENTGYVAFAADLAALKQTKVKVCTVNVTTSNAFPDGTEYVSESNDWVEIRFGAYDLYELPSGCIACDSGVSYGAIFEGDMPDMTATDNFVDGDEVISIGTQESNSGIYFTNGFIYKYVAPPEPSWSDKLIEWFKEQVEQIFQICDTIREYIRAILAVI